MRLDDIIRQPFSTLLTDLLQRTVTEFESNERLKWGLIAAIFIMYTALTNYFSEQAEKAKLAYLDSQNQLNILTAQISETRWPERAVQARSLVEKLNAQFWPGETTGLAEAGFERWVRQSFDRYGTEVRQVQLTRGPVQENQNEYRSETLSDVLVIRAKAIGPLKEDALISFLNDAAQNPSQIIVEQLIIRSGRNPRFEIDLATFIRTGSSVQ